MINITYIAWMVVGAPWLALPAATAVFSDRLASGNRRRRQLLLNGIGMFAAALLAAVAGIS